MDNTPSVVIHVTPSIMDITLFAVHIMLSVIHITLSVMYSQIFSLYYFFYLARLVSYTFFCLQIFFIRNRRVSFSLRNHHQIQMILQCRHRNDHHLLLHHRRITTSFDKCLAGEFSKR